MISDTTARPAREAGGPHPEHKQDERLSRLPLKDAAAARNGASTSNSHNDDGTVVLSHAAVTVFHDDEDGASPLEGCPPPHALHANKFHFRIHGGDSYYVTRYLAAGGFGEAYLCKELSSGKHRVLKLMKRARGVAGVPSRSVHPEIARLASIPPRALQHPNIIRTLLIHPESLEQDRDQAPPV